ncbi:(2Fe-2S)-binding protein [Paroceanicella profunda]|uniref:(2Fe-2S)-binding protein n=1 Tax=Paroceanicella profunda TaxID=2579971 RepID=A0A5B8FID5_9RHOB|nr:(2Fe-2S)-binding protein [Paroceanicella profunda]QDL93127.1 (2Fe-2S)-binding protein [Paroceanicella profunda]
MVTFTVNNAPVDLDVDQDKPLLWVLREDLGILGPKYGCGVAQCGACRVLVNGVSVPSCVTFAGDLEGAEVVTIEGLAEPDGTLSVVQQAWIDEQVPQCGFCQPGFIIAATALLASNPNPSDAEIDEEISNICRCGTYPRIRRAIHRAAAALSET